jgi:uncharacterized protein YciU (UPF0263 family)
MPQFKECTVDELLRDSLIEFSLKHNNKMMFELLTGEDWKDHVVKEEYKEKYNKDEIELHKQQEAALDKYMKLVQSIVFTIEKNKIDESYLYKIFANNDLVFDINRTTDEEEEMK